MTDARMLRPRLSLATRCRGPPETRGPGARLFVDSQPDVLRAPDTNLWGLEQPVSILRQDITGVITSICPLPLYSHHPLLMSPGTSWWLPTNHKSLSNPLLYSRTNCLQSVKIGQVPSLPLRRQTGFAKQQTANTSGTNLEIGNDFIWAESERA